MAGLMASCERVCGSAGEGQISRMCSRWSYSVSASRLVREDFHWLPQLEHAAGILAAEHWRNVFEQGGLC